jgi:hypothetical protein
VERLLEGEECGRLSEVGADGLAGVWTDDEPPAVVVFCSECAGHEFDD